MDEGVRHFREQVMPELRKMAGSKGAYLLLDRKSGKSLVIALWEAEKDLQASAAAADRLRAQATQTAGAAKPPMVEIYEVAVQP